MSLHEQPFNVEIFQPSAEQLRYLKPVTSADYHENTKGDLHEDGLFSISIFGRIGDEVRDRRFSYIDIKTEVFHPIIYNRLIKLKKLYQGILNGDQYALWDDEKKDFVPSNELVGQTGFSFFCEHWKDIQFVRNRSDIRDMRVKLIEQYRDRAMTSKILVLPAGLRDIEVDENGRTNVNEINALYLKLLSISRVLPEHDHIANDPTHNLARKLLQAGFNDIYNLIESMLSGKEGFFQSKWGSRNVVDSTRNVITAMDTSVARLGAINAPRFTDTIVGLWQLCKAVLPITVHHLKFGYLSEAFPYGNRTARLIDPTTLKSEIIEVSSDAYDRWNTIEGLEKVVTSYRELTLRDKPVTIDDRYLALIYAPRDNLVYRVFYDIDELPEHLSRDDVHPLNLMELIYLSGRKIWNDQVGTVTRYPITNVGSCYPTTVYVKTTVVGEVRRELGSDWNPLTNDDSSLVPEFPTYEPLAYQDSLVIPSTRLAGLSADNPQSTSCGDVRRARESTPLFP